MKARLLFSSGFASERFDEGERVSHQDEIEFMQGLCKLSQMQFIAKQLSDEETTTSNAHPELADHGSGYSWGYAKLMFRKNNTNGTSNEKAQRQKRNVVDAASAVNLTIEHVCKFVRKARDCKMFNREIF